MASLAPPCPTASKLALAFACPASVILQHGVPDEPSPDAEWGRLVHAGAEALANDMPLETACDVAFRAVGREEFGVRARLFATLNQIAIVLNVDRLDGPREWHVEPGYAYNLRTGAVRGPFKREPGDAGGPWEVPGSADLVFRRADGVLVVADWKPDMGKTARVGSMAEDHHQLYFLALCASRVHGAGAGVRVELRYYSEDGVRIDGAELDEADLALFEADLLSLAKRLAEYPVPVPGWHCEGRHCRARATCPATTAIVGASALAPVLPELVRRMPSDDDEYRALYTLLRAIDAWTPEARRRLDAYVLARPDGVEVAPGVKVKAIPQKQGAEVVDTPEALEKLKDKALSITRSAADVGNMLAALFESKCTTGLGRIDKAVRVATGKRGNDLKKARAAFRAELAEAGVIREGTSVLRVQEVRDEERRAGAVDTTGEEVE